MASEAVRGNMHMNTIALVDTGIIGPLPSCLWEAWRKVENFGNKISLTGCNWCRLNVQGFLNISNRGREKGARVKIGKKELIKENDTRRFLTWGIQIWPLRACQTDFVLKFFQFFTQPPILTQLFILQREEKRKEGAESKNGCAVFTNFWKRHNGTG